MEAGISACILTGKFEEIQLLYTTLTLEEVYATILYYLHNLEQIKSYVADWLEFSHQARREAKENPSPVAQRLRVLRDEIDAYPPEEREAARQRLIARVRRERNLPVTTESVEAA